MRVLITGTALAFVLAGVAVPADAADATGTLTLKADRHASVAVTFRNQVQVWTDGAAGGSLPEITGGGDYAGFVFVPERGTGPEAAVVRIPGRTGGATTVRVGEGGKPTLPAGRYTVRVLAEEPVVIRLAVRGLRSTTLRATRPMPVRRYETTFAEDTGRQLAGRGGVRLGARSAVFTVAAFRMTGTTVSASWCLTPAPACRPGETRSDSHTFLPFADEEIVARYTVRPGSAPSGPLTARWTVGSDVLVREPRAYVLVVG